MKKRWMASVLETSRQPAVALPFHRTVRKLAKDKDQDAATQKTA